MRRRVFIAGLGGAAAWPLVARGQQAPVGIQRIGVLMPFAADDPQYRARITLDIRCQKNPHQHYYRRFQAVLGCGIFVCCSGERQLAAERKGKTGEAKQHHRPGRKLGHSRRRREACHSCGPYVDCSPREGQKSRRRTP
jgi:hypothetical protein